MKIGNIFLALIFLPSFLIVCAQEETEVSKIPCDEYAARNKPFKVEHKIESNEPITDKNVSCIWSFGSDKKKCTFESKILETGLKNPPKECHNITSSPKMTFDGTKCALEFDKTSNITTLIKEKHRQNPNSTFM